MKFLILTAMTMAAAIVPMAAATTKPSASEMSKGKKWAESMLSGGETVPFSFVYDGQNFDPANWKRTSSISRLSNKRTEQKAVYTDPKTGLQVVCASVQYADFPTVEWTLKFKNTGKADTPIISDIRPLNIKFERKKQEEFRLHWNNADNCSVDSYGPHVDEMWQGAEFKAASADGRPTSGGYPYWNVEYDGGGIIAVLSWGGQWSAQFTRDQGKLFALKAGQELTHFVLHPGEEVTSPLAIVQFYQGDWIRAQNIWRRWMLAYNLPRPNGKPVKPFTYGCDGDQYPGMKSNLEGEEFSISKFCEKKVGLDSWDQDAGWYPCGDAWWNTGDWKADPIRFPGGMGKLGDFLHKYGMKFMLWFEPERAAGGSPIVNEHPDWFYGGKDGGLLKLGEPDVLKWTIEHFDGLIKSSGVDIYRQDFNMGPISSWRGNDAPDRQGITEIRHVEAYYAYWDELLRRNPHLLIDTCASGGRRNNVETLRRSVPVLRTDFAQEPIGNQGHSYGLSMWVPFYGTGQNATSAYDERSALSPIFGLGGDARKPDLNWGLIKQTKKEWQALSACMLGDYYPLTRYSLDKKSWLAMQWDVPEKGKGAVQVFRRDEADEDGIALQLRGLEPDADYEIRNLDEAKPNVIKGKELMDRGLRVLVKSKPGAAIVTYRKVKR